MADCPKAASDKHVEAMRGWSLLCAVCLLLLELVACGRDFYKILDLPRNADKKMIKKAYKKKALKW